MHVNYRRDGDWRSCLVMDFNKRGKSALLNCLNPKFKVHKFNALQYSIPSSKIELMFQKPDQPGEGRYGGARILQVVCS